MNDFWNNPPEDEEPRSFPDRTIPYTDEQLASLRQESELYLVDRCAGEPGAPHPSDQIVNFTCDDCSKQRTCFFSYDPYNTDGDCLAEK